MRARLALALSWSGLVLALGLATGGALLAGGVALVLTHRIDALTAAMVGGLALAVTEGAAGGAERLAVVPVVAGTWIGRVLVVGASVVAALGVALVIGPGGRPSAASLLVGVGGVLAFLALVGVQVFRPPR